MVRHRVWLAAALALMAVGNGFVRSEEKPQPKPAAEAGEKPEGVAKPVDPFAVPEGNDSKVLNLFMGRLMRTPPKTRTPEGILEHLNKLSKVADELMSREIDDALLEQAVGIKYQTLQLRSQFGDETAAKDREAFIAASLKDQRAPVANFAKQMLKMQKIQGMADLKPEERKSLIAELVKDLQTGELVDDEIQFAMMAAEVLENAELTEEAVAALGEMAKAVEASGSPNAKRIVGMLEGKSKRLGLLNNEMELAGDTFEGQPFDLKSLKGKVVLVDFWATWCGPCRGEIPNMKEQYELYHEKGFEIVGVSIDDDRKALEEFLGEEKLPWIHLHQNDGTGSHANAERYAINAIPACFLIDQSGKVVNLNCRGPVLAAMLEKLLGPVEKKAAPEEKADPTEKKE